MQETSQNIQKCFFSKISLENEFLSCIFVLKTKFLKLYPNHWTLMYTHAEHIRKIWRCMLSIRSQFVHLCTACAYKMAFYSYICKHKLTMRLQVVYVLYAGHMLTTRNRMPSIRMPSSTYIIKV